MQHAPHTAHETDRSDGSAGSSLIEVLVGVSILATVFLTVIGGMATSVSLSGRHRERAQVENVLTSGAELVKQTPKVACATPTTPSYVAAAQAAATREGWNASRMKVTAIRYWDGTGYGTTCYDNTTNRLPLQQITLTVTHPGQRVVQSLTFVKGVG